jgi:hypothetical protein
MSDGLGEGGLTKARKIFDQQVTASQQAGKDVLNNRVFSAQGSVELGAERIDGRSGGG